MAGRGGEEKGAEPPLSSLSLSLSVDAVAVA